MFTLAQLQQAFPEISRPAPGETSTDNGDWRRDIAYGWSVTWSRPTDQPETIVMTFIGDPVLCRMDIPVLEDGSLGTAVYNTTSDDSTNAEELLIYKLSQL